MIRTEQAHLPVVALTHPGMTGKNNEDRYDVSAYRSSGAGGQPALLAVLSDGIGGHRAGEVAAEMAVRTISQFVAQSDERADPVAVLESAIQLASQQIYEHAQVDVQQRGMGATCAVAWIVGRRVFAATVGDSRLYLLRGRAIIQLSTDHTWIQEALERGYIQPEEVRGHPNAHVIRRYLGSPSPPRVDLRLRLSSRESDTESEANQGMPLLAGDRLVLCSDGLTDLVENHEILATFASMDTRSAAQTLMDLANARGGHDNITIVAIDVPPEVGLAAGARGSGAAGGGRRWLRLGCTAALITALLVTLVLGGLWLLNGPLLGGSATATPPSPGVNPGVIVQSATPTLTATITAAPEIIRSPVPTRTPTRGYLAPGEPTLTPWPTNTPAP